LMVEFGVSCGPEESSVKEYQCQECSVPATTLSWLPVLEGAAEGAVYTLLCWKFDRTLHNKYCGVLFQCGCTWDWDGGWKNCALLDMGDSGILTMWFARQCSQPDRSTLPVVRYSRWHMAAPGNAPHSFAPPTAHCSLPCSLLGCHGPVCRLLDDDGMDVGELEVEGNSTSSPSCSRDRSLYLCAAGCCASHKTPVQSPGADIGVFCLQHIVCAGFLRTHGLPVLLVVDQG